MIHPSYSELIDAINTNNEEDAQSQVLNSRYSLVLATSKRARQLIAGAKPLVENAAGKKPLAIAIDELYRGKVKILAEKEGDEELSIEETDEETQVVIEDAESSAAEEAADTEENMPEAAADAAEEAAGTGTDDAAGISEAAADTEPDNAAEPED